ncbi:MAG: hypothetical protein EA383_10895 [Spirochaetaceae bacterium]|nr:MAG: hypothetical protein EA383_10895 [Spirochaetaceae bacterium]
MTRTTDQHTLYNLARTAPAIFFRFESGHDGSMGFPYISESFEAILGLKPKEVEQDISRALALVHGDDSPALLDSIAHAVTNASGWSHEFRAISSSGETIWLDGAAECVGYVENRLRFEGYLWNISRQKDVETAARKQIREKELLLSEMKHRVKNNMATVLSLLELQKTAVSNADVYSALQTAQGRIRSVLMLYDGIESTEQAGSVQADSYLSLFVPQVVAGLTHRESLDLDIVVEPLRVDGKLMSVLALIINESVTNALKYAFNEDATKRIEVHFGRTDRGTMMLTISDNGQGFAEDSSEGLGMTIIRSLCDQIDATLSIQSEQGTSIQLEIPA